MPFLLCFASSEQSCSRWSGLWSWFHFAMETSTSFHCEIESAWEGASRHQSVDGLCHFCCDSPHPSRAVSAGAACGAGSISQWKLVLQLLSLYMMAFIVPGSALQT